MKSYLGLKLAITFLSIITILDLFAFTSKDNFTCLLSLVPALPWILIFGPVVGQANPLLSFMIIIFCSLINVVIIYFVGERISRLNSKN